MSKMSVDTVPPTPKINLWLVLWDFAIQTVVGTIIFVVMAIPAITLNLGFQRVEMMQLARPLLVGLMVAEYALFLADLIVFLYVLYRAVLHAVRGI